MTRAEWMVNRMNQRTEERWDEQARLKRSAQARAGWRKAKRRLAASKAPVGKAQRKA